MKSFLFEIDPRRAVAARFIGAVRAALQQALGEEERERGLSKADVANALGIHRSAITRRVRGMENLTLRSIAEMAWAMGREPVFTLERIEQPPHSNETYSAGAATAPAEPVPQVTLSGSPGKGRPLLVTAR